MKENENTTPKYDEQEWINQGCPKTKRDIVATDGNYFIFGDVKDCDKKE